MCTLVLHPAIDDGIRPWHSVISKAVVLEVDLRNPLLQPFHETLHLAKSILVLQAVRHAGEGYGTVVEEETDEGAGLSPSSRGARHDLPDEVGRERDYVRGYIGLYK